MIIQKNDKFGELTIIADITSLGYPPGFHMGFSAILWWIIIAINTTLSVLLYLNSRKSDLINVKEMFRAKAILYIGESINFSLVQIGVFYPNNFLVIFFIGSSFLVGSLVIYFYYWEKNLTSIKHIPTIASVVASIITIITLVFSILNVETVLLLMDLITTLVLALVSFAFILYIYLIYGFSKHVKGVSTRVTKLWILGIIIAMVGLTFEYPPGVKTAPLFLVYYIPSIFLILCNGFAFYGTITLFPHMSSYYAQMQKCTVHRGTIEKGSIVYYCPSCGITYCESCFNQVIKKDGCWNCRKGAEPEVEIEWKIEHVELKKNSRNKINAVKKGAKLNPNV